MAVEHLTKLGHKRIGIVCGRRNVMTGKDRLLGYIKALEDYNVGVDDNLVRDGDFSVEGGKRATEELLSMPGPPTAIFSSNNLMTAGMLLIIRENNIRIPEEIALSR